MILITVIIGLLTVFSNIFSGRDLKKVFVPQYCFPNPLQLKKKKWQSRNSILKSCSCIMKSLSHEKSSVCECIYVHLNQKEEVHGCVLFFQTMKYMFYTCGSESNSHVNWLKQVWYCIKVSIHNHDSESVLLLKDLSHCFILIKWLQYITSLLVWHFESRINIIAFVLYSFKRLV